MGALNGRVNFRKWILLLPAIVIAVLEIGCASSKPWRPEKLGVLGMLGKNWQGRPIDPTPTFADVAYGTDARHRLDFFQAPGEGPRPLYVFFFHGGGFSVGDKWGLRSSVIRAFHARGISVASCNYRLAQSSPLPQPLHDGARAIQFLRSKAGEWGIDSQRVAAGGHSAGGLMALWLAAHDDLADPASPPESPAPPPAMRPPTLTPRWCSDGLAWNRSRNTRAPKIVSPFNRSMNSRIHA